MEDTKNENLNSTNEETNNEVVVDESVEETTDEEVTKEADTEVSRAEYEKLRKEKDELYIQLKKAKAAKVQTKAEAPSNELSTKDVLFLAKAQVHEDDIDEVLEWAKFKKVPVAEAYKQLKGVLNGKAEERKVANATNTGGSRRGTAKISDETLLERASKGELPDDDENLTRLIRLRKGLK